MAAVPKKQIAMSALNIIKGICEYQMPSRSDILWWSVGIASFFTDAFSLQYLFTVHLFVDTYIAALMASLYSGLTGIECGGPLPTSMTCYCVEGQDMASFLWMIVIGYWEYVRGAPIMWKSIFIIVAFTIYVISLVVGGSCSVSGVGFAFFVGAFLGAIKIYAYAAVCAPMVAASLRRWKATVAIAEFDTARFATSTSVAVAMAASAEVQQQKQCPR